MTRPGSELAANAGQPHRKGRIRGRISVLGEAYDRCQVNEDLTLSDRVFKCGSCGHTADRDENAAENIRLLAVSSTERINGRGGDVRPLDPERRMPEKRQLKLVG